MQGAPGATGPVGPPGAQGERGPDGPQGTQGMQGDPVSLILHRSALSAHNINSNETDTFYNKLQTPFTISCTMDTFYNKLYSVWNNSKFMLSSFFCLVWCAGRAR